MLRFLIGGILVSAFAALGSAFKPKTFAGLFGAAPPIALAGLGWAFHAQGRGEAVLLARSMLIGSAGLLTYSVVCTAMVRRRRVWVLPASLLAWVAWFVSVLALFELFGLR